MNFSPDLPLGQVTSRYLQDLHPGEAIFVDRGGYMDEIRIRVLKPNPCGTLPRREYVASIPDKEVHYLGTPENVFARICLEVDHLVWLKNRVEDVIVGTCGEVRRFGRSARCR